MIHRKEKFKYLALYQKFDSKKKEHFLENNFVKCVFIKFYTFFLVKICKGVY